MKAHIKQRIFQIIKWSGVGFILFFLLLLIAAQIYEDEIGARVVRELNKSMKKPVQVEHVDLTLLRTFPKASVILTDIEIPDSKKGILVNAKKMSLQFGFLSLFQDKIDVQSVIIEHGSLNVSTNKKGQANYDIFLETGNTETTETDIKIDVQNAVLNDIHVIYENQQLAQSGILHVENLVLSGNFSTRQFNVKSTAELNVEFLNTKDGELLSGRSLAYETRVKVDLDKGEYELKNTNLYIEDNKFSVNGKVISKADYTDLNVSLQGVDGNLYSVVSLLPKNQMTFLEDFSTRGSFHVKSNIKGRLSESSTPSIDLEFGLKDGYLSSKRLKNELKNVSFEVHFENEEKSKTQKAFVEMIEFEGELLNEKLSASLYVEDLDNPLIDFRFEGKVPLEAASAFLESDLIEEGDGMVDFKGIIIEGYYKDMLSMTGIRNITANGFIGIENMNLDVKGEEISMEKGEIAINNNNLEINNIALKVADNDLRLQGDFQNLLPVLLSDSTSKETVKLVFDTKLESENLDLDKLLAFVEKVQTVPEKELKEIPRPETLTEKGNVTASPYYEFLKLFDGNFVVSVGEFKYEDINAKNCSGNLTVENGRVLLQNVAIDLFKYGKIVAEDFTGNVAFQGKMMILKDISVNTMGGNIKMTSNVYLDEETFLDGYVECKGLDGYTLFNQLDNFGQDFLVAKNIKGDFDAKVRLKTYWDKDGNVLYKKLYTLADVTIINGELIGLKMLEEFSKFIKVDDLKKVKFTETRNQLEFKNGRLTIPAMFIQNNAANMTIAGWQDYDSDFEYNIKVNAGQTIANKFKRFNPTRKPIKSKNGWLNIYVQVTGDADNYDFKYSKKTVEAAFEGELKRKFKQIQNDILTEFKKNPLEEPKDWENSIEVVN